ncbi:dTDP-4-dehydrorhamnose 3,5-epimerase [Novosphingobium resinovorum]|uniref:dTDP-4-dehydrorhamnose 3,5-epimerase n=1 Tax=Novosphingobium resinovorum TaxID=158500 RepID=UPI002ED34C51|nr:dTDP-4-dehydrorhamnose 3,5-epimerase [Novosphingobium resinovorum]
MNGVILTSLRRIATLGGDVLHGMKQSDEGFAGFGEAYFSRVSQGHVKGWKRHNRMTLNFVVASGQIRVGVRDDAAGETRYFLLGPDTPESHARLTIGAGLWVAFGGVAPGESVLLNLASIEHDPTESETMPLETFSWEW